MVRQGGYETGKPSPISARFWKLPVPANGVALLQAATDQTAWTTQANITNNQTVMGNIASITVEYSISGLVSQ